MKKYLVKIFGLLLSLICTSSVHSLDLLRQSPTSLKEVNSVSSLPYELIKPEPASTKGLYNIIISPAPDTVWKIYQKSTDKKEWSDADMGSKNLNKYTFDSLTNGEKYYYRVIGIEVNTGLEYESEIHFSYQDDLFPKVYISNLDSFQNSKLFYISFNAKDDVCDSLKLNIQRAELYFRPETSGDWLLNHSKEYPDTIKAAILEFTTQDSFSFCPDSYYGDGYYEFFVQARDWACAPDDTIPDGNENPIDLPSMAWAFTYVDTKLPTSQITSKESTRNTLTFDIAYWADDHKSDARKYESGIDQVILYYSYKQDRLSEFIVNYDSALAIFHDGDTSKVTGKFNFNASHGNGIYEFSTKAIDRAGNWEAQLNKYTVKVDTTRPVIRWLEGYTDSTKTDSFACEWQNKCDSPYFIWDDPKSFTGDSFFVNISRNIWSKIHLDTAITDTFLNLQSLGIHLGEGEHVFKLWAKSGSRLISETLKYLILFDTTKPNAKTLIDSSIIASPDKIIVGYKVDDPPKFGTESGISEVSLYWSNENRLESFKKDGIHYYKGNTSIDSVFHFDPKKSDGIYYFKVAAKDSAQNCAWSNTDSAIVIRLKTPNRGEYLRDSVSYDITWSPEDSALATILLSSNGGLSFPDIIISDTLLNGKYTWTPDKNINSNLCKVKIIATFTDTDTKNKKMSEDQSDGNFIIDNQPPDSVQVLFPNGGESIAEGCSTLVVWKKAEDNYTPQEAMSINVYSKINNQSSLIASTDSTGEKIESILPTDTSFVWSVPDSINSDLCKIVLHIFDIAGNVAIDESDAFFSIKPYPHIKNFDVLDSNYTLITDVDSIKYAIPGWSNHQEILSRIEFEANYPDSIRFWIGYDGFQDSTDWETLTINADGVALKILNLENDVNTTYEIKCQAKNKTGPSNSYAKSIKLDTTKPANLTIESPDLISNYGIRLKISADDTIQLFPATKTGKPHRILLSEDASLLLNHSSTKLYWGWQEYVNYSLSQGEGEKIIYCQVADSAGNWSDIHEFVVYVDQSPPVAGFNPPMNSFIHVNNSNLEIIEITFSEMVKPDVSWDNSIKLLDVYKNKLVPREWYNIIYLNNNGKDTIKIISTRIFDPSKYHIEINSYHDLIGNPGIQGISSFYIFCESETGGTVYRILPEIENSKISIELFRSEPAGDIVIMVDSFQVPSKSSPDWVKLMEFEPVQNTGWQLSLLNEDSLIVDHISGLSNSANIFMYSDIYADLFKTEGKIAQIAHKCYDSPYWELVQNVNFDKIIMNFQNFSVKKVSGYYCAMKLADSNQKIAYCYPNPFSISTKIRFYLTEKDNVNFINIYDAFGNLVIKKDISIPGAGLKEIEWDGVNGQGQKVANGGYICMIKNDIYIKIYVLR